MSCQNHPNKESVANCQFCGKELCEDCAISIAGKNYCEDCMSELVGPEIASIAIGKSDGALQSKTGDGNIEGTQTPDEEAHILETPETPKTDKKPQTDEKTKDTTDEKITTPTDEKTKDTTDDKVVDPTYDKAEKNNEDLYIDEKSNNDAHRKDTTTTPKNDVEEKYDYGSVTNFLAKMRAGHHSLILSLKKNEKSRFNDGQIRAAKDLHKNLGSLLDTMCWHYFYNRDSQKSNYGNHCHADLLATLSTI